MWIQLPFAPLCPDIHLCVGQCQLLNPLSDFYEIQYIYKVLSSKRELHENPLSDSHTFHEGNKRISLRTLHIYLSIWVKFAIRDLHIKQFSIYEFCENRRRKWRAFVIAVL
jgi:hypothetical protein